MLNVYFGDMPEEKESIYIYNTSIYFNNTYLDSWITDDFSKRIIKNIDKATVLSPNAVDSATLGVIPVTQLAGEQKRFCLYSMTLPKFSMLLLAGIIVLNGYCVLQKEKREIYLLI